MSRRTTFNPDAPFQSITAASRITGLSQCYIRSRCRKGDIPVLRVGDGGTAYMINVPALLRQLEREAGKGVTA